MAVIDLRNAWDGLLVLQVDGDSYLVQSDKPTVET